MVNYAYSWTRPFSVWRPLHIGKICDFGGKQKLRKFHYFNQRPISPLFYFWSRQFPPKAVWMTPLCCDIT